MKAENKLYRSIILVNDRPYAIWDTDLKRKNIEFLRNFDPEFFSYMADVHIRSLIEDQGDSEPDSDKSQEPSQRQLQAAIALRSAYSQGLETLFALIFATIQAPHQVPAWMLLYWPKDLYELIDAIDSHKDIPNLLKLDVVS
jgi:hypothetical protein